MVKPEETKMDFEDLDNAVDTILTAARTKVENIIEKFNKQNEGEIEIDTVDLYSKFDPLYDYVEDYSE